MALNNDNMEGANGQNLRKTNQYVMAQTKCIKIQNTKDYSTFQYWDMQINEHDIEILYMAISFDD